METTTNWFSVNAIHTMGGSSFAVLIIVELIKDWPLLRHIPTYAQSAIVAELLLVLTVVPLPSTVSGWVILLLNGLLSAFTAIGGSRFINSKTTNE